MQLVTLGWSQCSFTILKILRPLRIMLNLFFPWSINTTIKLGWQHICLQNSLLNMLNPLCRIISQKKRFLLIYNCLLKIQLVTCELGWRSTMRLMTSSLLTQHYYTTQLHSVVQRLGSNFDFQVFVFKKQIS